MLFLCSIAVSQLGGEVQTPCIHSPGPGLPQPNATRLERSSAECVRAFHCSSGQSAGTGNGDEIALATHRRAIVSNRLVFFDILD